VINGAQACVDCSETSRWEELEQQEKALAAPGPHSISSLGEDQRNDAAHGGVERFLLSFRDSQTTGSAAMLMHANNYS
jgi:hypothetical protein